jgi:hypothetical protein
MTCLSINLPLGNAIICGVKSKCKHSWDGKLLYSLSDGRHKLEFEMLPKEMDLIIGGETTCSLCGIAYTTENNPNFM